jgi:hypothetical protein
MSRSRISPVLVVLAALALALPLAAHPNPKKVSKSNVHATMDLLTDANLAGKQVKPGTYDVKANETTITLIREGKVIAQAPIEWKGEASKQKYSSIIVESGAVKEVHFDGQTRYAQIAEGAMTTASGQE